MEPKDALATLVRTERTRLVATLVRRYGFDLAEEAVDAAIEAALEQWPNQGMPASPRAWLLSVARRRAIDRVRHQLAANVVHDTLRTLSAVEAADVDDPNAADLPDDRLRLVFTCCHPAIAREAQVALALRWLSSLSTEEVARAFCVPVPTMAQRLTRAKTKIEAARIPYEVPERSELAGRLGAVLEVVYAIFNEGYIATTGSELQRVDLADEGTRLAELVVQLLPDASDARSMLALLLLIHARRRARVASDGAFVPLEEQDRALWDCAEIAKGKALLEEALSAGPPSAYAVEAAIQAVHDDAPTWASTDFAQIVTLYRILRDKTDAPIVRLNEAVARSMVDGPAAVMADIAALEQEGSLAGHPALPAAKADLLRRLGDHGGARIAYEAAILATKNDVEREFLARRSRALA